MRWRRIIIDGKSYRYHVGKGTVVIRTPDGATLTPKAERVKGLSAEAFERGVWKGTEDGMIRPIDVRRFVVETTLTAKVV
jgi:hypothetical protein